MTFYFGEHMFSGLIKSLIIISMLTFSFSALAMELCEDVFPNVTTEYGAELQLPVFQTSNSTLGDQSGSSLSLAAGEYNNIALSANGELTFTTTNGEFKANTVTIGQGAIVNFVAGDYYFSNFDLSEDSVVNVTGSGTVRIFVENNLTLEPEVLINDDEDPLLVVVYGSVDALTATEVRFSGLMYVVNSITIGNRIDIHGAITGLAVNLTSPEILDYVDDFINEIDFDGLCTNALIDFRDALLGYYPFEQSDFNVNVVDESGNNNHGLNLGGSVTTSGQYCSGFSSNGNNTTSLTDNAFSTNIDLDDDVGVIGTISFWYQANNDWNEQDRTLFNASMINGADTDGDNKYFYLQIEESGLSFEFENNDDDDFSITEDFPSNVGDSGVWHYISVTWNLEDDEFQIYIDSNLLVERSEDDDGSDFDTDRSFGELGNIVFGDNATDYINGGRFTSADGNYDEVRIYNQVLSQSEIEADMNDNDCIDHYQIEHQSNGLTCTSENITIRACSNRFDSGNISCNEVEQPVSLTVDGNNSTIANVNFTSSVLINYNHTVAEVVTLGLSNISENPVNGFHCINSNTSLESNCETTFADTGFIFLTDNVLGLNSQLSGKASNIGFNAGTISVQAVETDNNTGACSAILVDQNIELAAQCTDSSTCTSNLSVNSSDIITAPNTPTTYTSLDLGFAGSDSADIVLNYPDAGSLTLHARYNIPIDGVPSGNFIEGSAEFTVRPLGFDVAITGTNASGSINNPATQDASGDAFVAAGDNVDVQITAKQWQASDDTNNDGIPDIDADLSNNTTTINFTDNVEITHQLVSPLGGENPNLSNNSISLFNNGVATLSTSWPEVGILSFTVQIDDSNYLGAGDVQGFAPFVGRFIPSYYQQTVDEHGSLMANSNSWVYSGETDGTAGTIRYDTLPVYRITAFSADDTVTENYTIGGDFIKLMASGITVDEPLNDHVQLGVNVIDNVTLTAELITGTLEAHSTINGALTYTFNDLDHFFYTKEANSEIAPFTAQIPLGIDSLIDSDDVTYGTDSNNDALLESAIATGIEVRFGRLFIPNSYGPETEPLTIPMQLQVFDGVTYRIHNDDSNTVLSTENNEVALIYDGTATDYLATDTASVNAITSTPVQGYVYFIDLSSNNNERGRVDLEYTTVNWLQHDWSGDSIFDENPNATAQFGVFRGNDRIILWREINQ